MIGKTNAISGVSAPVPKIKTVSGSVISVSDALAMPAVSLLVDINAVQSGSGDPSPSNVRPISGWSSVKVTRTGKNLCSINALPTNPGIYWGSNNRDMVAFLNTLPTGTYVLYITQEVVTLPANGKVTHGRPYLTAIVNGAQTPVLSYSVTNDDSPIVGKTYRDGGTFTITDAIRGNFNNCYFYCDQQDTHTGSGRGTYNVKDIQLELSSTATAYEPYNGNTYTIQLGQTVYGGSLDVTTGVLTKVPYYNSYNGETLVGPWVSSMDKYVSGATPTTGAQVVDLGGTGTDVQLTATEVEMLLGNNTLWADSGDSTLQYLARR